jgi:proteic killer suppression protein
MILSFKDKETEAVYNERFSKKLPPDVQHTALRKLIMLQHSKTLQDLMIPPGNKLEPLHGDRKGQHSIRINSQWRICFEWDGSNAGNVEITDYH